MDHVDRERLAGALPGFELGEVLGRGTFGVVVSGRDDLGREVAIKVLAAHHDGAVASFKSEARTLASLKNQHIVQIYRYLEHDNLHLIIMELLAGGTLADQRTPFSPEGACAVGLAVAEALSYAHTRGVLHRDIKPGNLVFAHDETGDLLKVTDFGISKIFEGSAATASAVVGTPRYMAPEQINPNADEKLVPATDIYALGGVLYELFAGVPPFDPKLPLVARYERQQNVIPPPPAGVPAPVVNVVMRALASQPASRYPSAQDFAVDLARAATHSYGPGWTSRSGFILHVREDVRRAAEDLSAALLAPPDVERTARALTGRVAPPSGRPAGGSRPDGGRFPQPPPGDCDAAIESLKQGMPGRLRRAVGRLQAAFDAVSVTEKDRRRAAGAYRDALSGALRHRPALAVSLFSCYDARIPADRYGFAFRAGDVGWLTRLAEQGDQDVLTVVLGLAERLGLQAPRTVARDRLANMLGRQRDAGPLVAHLLDWQDRYLLDIGVLTAVLQDYVTHTSLDRDAHVWSSFFADLPVAFLPELFEVRLFLGRGADAVRLADTAVRQRAAVECCLRSALIDDVQAGLELAGRINSPMLPALAERAGDLLFGGRQYAGALAQYRAAGRWQRVSECHERLGEVGEALTHCPDDAADRLARLVGLCLPDVDALIERQEFHEAARRVQELVGHLQRAAPVSGSLANRREELSGLRAAVSVAGRRHFGDLVQRASPAEQAAAYAAWSRFEEAAGEWSEAARRAEDGGDSYRAHRFYRRAGQFGQADRVLEDDHTAEGLATRAASLEAGGDPVAAARLYEEAGRLEEATGLFVAVGEYAAAARCLTQWRGDEAIEDPRLADCLRHTGDIKRLVRLCLQAVERAGLASRAANELRRLRVEALIPSFLASEVATMLETLASQARRPFEARAAQWVASARSEIEERFASIWGLDLGTSTCTAAIYDRQTGNPVLCPARGEVQFASTLSLDDQGNELVGLRGEEILGSRVRGHIRGAKRRMGTRTVYRIRDRSYRPEEVAARLIRHARGLVEGYLADQVRERVGELARAELGAVDDDWLTWAEQHHDLRISRERVVLTIPAYFLNNQKHATRDACDIAGVRAVRLIHEPTAACMSAARQRRLTGQVVVVDLGAGTLDVSFLDVDENLYDVQRVRGNNNYGSNDFDEAIGRALTEQLLTQGVRVPPTGIARQRLQVAAEYLKVCLSSQEDADYSLLSFVDGRNVRLELSRARLAEILEEPLRVLQDACAAFKHELIDQPQYLVLVGGPMLSPLVRGLVEKVFGLQQTVVADPRTAVASGAAIQAAVLAGAINERVLLDVTPLPLGIRVVDEENREDLSVIIGRNTHIPVERKNAYTTHHDNQTGIDIEIFNGDLDTSAKIGQFRLDGIPPTPRGTPRIEVTFAIDADCVLEVTAHDVGTGKSKSIRVNDSTLLSPIERDTMTRRHQEQREGERRRAEVDRLREVVIEAGSEDGDALWAEFQDRLTAFRPTNEKPDPETERVFTEIFNPANQMELEQELREIQETLRDVVANAKEYLERKPTGATGTTGASDPTDPTVAQHLIAELERQLSRLRPLWARLTEYNAALVRFAVTAHDPLLRFRERHDAGDHVDALHALGTSVPDRPQDLDRLLRCLAAVGDADRYQQALTDHGELLQVTLLDPANPAAFLRHAEPALVVVASTLANGRQVLGSGFLISDRLVATNRHWLVDQSDGRSTAMEPAQIEIRLDTGTRSVEGLFLPESSHSNVALVRLTEPAQGHPLRLGYPRLVRIGDRVWASPAPAATGPRTLRHGTVERFESFPEQNLQLVRTSLVMPPAASGGALFNTFGEVIGILTIGEQPEASKGTAIAAGIFALSVEALDPLLARAGAGRLGDQGG
ncbi:Hsp70 family protein [Frankia sp. Cr2]|uniref:Hsp70 family protein n=1 Tax=Frankia sp. Cr2 TaxID=3073932 RepID=UPI002AD458B1|nr:Hsp70 family protein [Frankia sp. Cr2]